MTIQITRPEVEALINERLQSGAFSDAEDVILQALKASGTAPPQRNRLDGDVPVRSLTDDTDSRRPVFEQGLGLFGSPEDAALMDEVVSIAYEERRRPSKREPAL